MVQKKRYFAQLDDRWVVLDDDNVEYRDGGKNVVLTPSIALELAKDPDLYELYKNNKKYRVKEAAIQHTVAFATGGFADFTGPAWLDGTKKRPEAVLNALQTKHFIQFTNVLDSLFGGHSSLMTPTQSAQKSGDANYTFYINVDQMASDYDVDRLIKRIEEKATKASQYRNVTVLKKSN